MKTTVNFVTQSCRRHKHNFYEILFYRKGTGTFYFSEKSTPISPGKFIIVPPEIVHASRYTEDAETIFVNGDFKHIFSFNSPAVVMDDDEKNGEFFMKMIYENRFSNPEYLSALSSALAHFLMQNIKTEKSISVVLKDIVTQISDNFHDSNIDVCEILAVKRNSRKMRIYRLYIFFKKIQTDNGNGTKRIYEGLGVIFT